MTHVNPFNIGLCFGMWATADSYCVFDTSQVAVKGEEMVQYCNPCANHAA